MKDLTQNTVTQIYTQKTVRTSWNVHEVANWLYEQIPPDQRLPGAPALSIEIKGTELLLIQSHVFTEHRP